jgi:GNAT superfamily N-acetyltransferase
MARRADLLLAGGFPYFVARHHGLPLCYAYDGPYRPRPAYRFTIEDSIYVDPAAQGRGIGGRLLGRLVEESARLGFRQMIAVIGDSADGGSFSANAARIGAMGNGAGLGERSVNVDKRSGSKNVDQRSKLQGCFFSLRRSPLCVPDLVCLSERMPYYFPG